MEELYRNDSSANYLGNINVPMVFINARDDPLVHPDMLNIPQAYIRKWWRCKEPGVSPVEEVVIEYL